MPGSLSGLEDRGRLVSQLPEGATYVSLAELLPALGLPIEQRPS